MKLIRFLVSGGLAAIVNLSILYILTEWVGWWYLASATISFLVSILVGFLLQKLWTFNHLQEHRTRRQFFLYSVWMLLYLGLNLGLMYLLVDGIKVYYLVSQFITSGILAVLSFFVYSRIVFIVKPTCREFILEKTDQ